MDSEIWRDIRALRAMPPSIAASDDDRRKTFAASLRQSEELADAALAVSYAAKPLPLFYSLSQAGRAIAAAHLQADWMLHGHGIGRSRAPSVGLLDKSVKPAYQRNELDSFTGVAAATGSPILAGAATLGELWSANPDLQDIPIPASAGSWPTALTLTLNMPSLLRADPNRLNSEAPFPTSGMVLIGATPLAGTTGRDISNALRAYPTLRTAFGITQGASGPVRARSEDRVNQSFDDTGTPCTNLAVEIAQTTTATEFWRRERALTSIVEFPKGRRGLNTKVPLGYALPEVGGGESPYPLMLWWALLLGLSSLARYEPAAWIDAIDLDKSELAVSLERVLEAAQVFVPERILDALTESSNGLPGIAV